MITNKPTIKDEKTDDLRSAFEHRATWFYYLIDEAVKNGLDMDFARKAIFRCGCFHGENNLPRTNDIKTFTDAFATEKVKNIFEMDVKNTDKELSIDFHYCPLVEAWQKLTGNEEKIAHLCDIAMDGDRGIIEKYDEFEFELGKTIAKGDDVCQIRIRKQSK